MRTTIANGAFASGTFAIPAIVGCDIAFDPKEMRAGRQGGSPERHTLVVDTPRWLGHSGRQMLCRAVSVPVLVPHPAVATGAGIELILVIPR